MRSPLCLSFLCRLSLPFVLGLVIAHRVLTGGSLRTAVREGLTADGHGVGRRYTPPPLSDDPLYLAKLNAANIAYLNTRTRNYDKISSDLASLKKQVADNSAALAKIAVQAQKALGGNAPAQPASIPPKYRN